MGIKHVEHGETFGQSMGGLSTSTKSGENPVSQIAPLDIFGKS